MTTLKFFSQISELVVKEVQQDQKILELSKEYLQQNSQDIDAKHILIVSHINLGKYKESLNIIQEIGMDKEFMYEKAYCLYRLGQLNESLSFINNALTNCDKERISPGIKSPLTELKAQVLYKLESFDQSFSIYHELIQNKKDDYLTELQTNYLASMASALFTNMELPSKKMSSITCQSYESLFNLACVQLAQGNLPLSKTTLDQALALCQSLIEEEEQEDQLLLQRELSMMKIQLGYIYFKLGSIKESKKVLHEIISSRTCQKFVKVMAALNLAAITSFEESSTYLAQWKMTANKKVLNKGLLNWQARLLSANSVLVSAYSKEYKRAKTQISDMQDNDIKYYLLAMCLIEENKPRLAIRTLKKGLKSHPNSVLIVMSLVQIYLLDKKFNSAKKTLEIFNKLQPNVPLPTYSTLAALYLKLKDLKHQERMNTLLARMESSSTNDVSVLYALASNKYQSGDIERASKDFETIVQLDPNNYMALAGLVQCLIQIDPERAEKFMDRIPELDIQMLDENDGDIENLDFLLDAMKASHSQQHVTKDIVDTEQSIKRKRKRKNKLPKFMDPNVKPDPERWIPKKQRASYLRKLKGKQIRGSQGTQAVTTKQPQIQKSDSNQVTSPATNVIANQVQRSVVPVNSKKKKKGRR